MHGTKHDGQALGASSVQIYKPTINILLCTSLILTCLYIYNFIVQYCHIFLHVFEIKLYIGGNL